MGLGEGNKNSIILIALGFIKLRRNDFKVLDQAIHHHKAYNVH